MTNNVAPLQAQGMLGKKPAERQWSAYYICDDYDGNEAVILEIITSILIP